MTNLYWEWLRGEPRPTKEEAGEAAFALVDPNAEVRDTLAHAVQIMRGDTARLNAALEETEEEREARLERQREYKRAYRARMSELSEVSENGQNGQNGQDGQIRTKRTEADKKDKADKSGQDGQLFRVSDYVQDTHSLTYPLTNSPTNTPLSPPRGARRDEESDAEFIRFWEAYGKKGSRKKAAQSFARARRSRTWPGIDALCLAVAVWRATDEWTKDGGQFQPHASTWLNQERWNDELPAEAKAEAEKEARLNAPPPHYDL